MQSKSSNGHALAVALCVGTLRSAAGGYHIDPVRGSKSPHSSPIVVEPMFPDQKAQVSIHRFWISMQDQLLLFWANFLWIGPLYL